jgi:hypothetical protein
MKRSLIWVRPYCCYWLVVFSAGHPFKHWPPTLLLVTGHHYLLTISLCFLINYWKISTVTQPVSGLVNCCVMARAVSCRSVTTEAWITSCDICSGQVALGHISLRVLRFLLSVSFYRGSPIHITWKKNCWCPQFRGTVSSQRHEQQQKQVTLFPVRYTWRELGFHNSPDNVVTSICWLPGTRLSCDIQKTTLQQLALTAVTSPLSPRNLMLRFKSLDSCVCVCGGGGVLLGHEAAFRVGWLAPSVPPQQVTRTPPSSVWY